MTELVFLAECRQAIRDGWLIDDPDRPVYHSIALVGTARSERESDVEGFVFELARRHPAAELVLGDTSNLERQAAATAEALGLRVTVVKKADRECWDEGADIRDERVVARATNVVAFDKSSRSKAYEVLAKRMRRKFTYYLEAA